MKYLVIFNFIVNLIIVSNYIYKKFPFYIQTNKTFWCEKIYSFTLMMYTNKDKHGSHTKSLLTLPIRNYNKIIKWDNKMLDTGKYKHYKKFKTLK